MTSRGTALLLLLALSSSGCLSAPDLPELPAEGAGATPASVVRDLRFSDSSESLKLDIYLPQRTGPVPVIMYAHGGAWVEGSRSNCPARPFTDRGYAVVCYDYRLAKTDGERCDPETIFPAQIEDAKAAVRWVRLHSGEYGLNPDRLAALGDSSGGHLSALLGTSAGVRGLEGPGSQNVSDKVQAVVDWYGPADTLDGPRPVFPENPCNTSLDYLNSRYGGESTPYFYWTWGLGMAFGGSWEDSAVRARARMADPAEYAGPEDPPFLIIHGENDSMVPLNQSGMLYDALKSKGVDARFIRLPGAGHSYGPGARESPDEPVSREFLEPTLDFLDSNLK